MPMKNATPRIFAVLRVVESKICFLDLDDAFAELNDRTVLYDSRDECYTDARKCQGLVCSIGWRMAQAHGVKNAIWDMQRESEDPGLTLVSDAAA